MSIILNIDTAIDTANLSIAENGNILVEISNDGKKDHGSFLQPAIESILKSAGLVFKDIDAVAVSAGPGSYTGLRVGMASAKGLAFALDKPLLTIGTLKILAYATLLQLPAELKNKETLICPMIDARRMEVFTALFDQLLNVLSPAAALVLNEHSFAKWLLKNKVVFSANGSEKWKAICVDPNAAFFNLKNNSLAMNVLSHQKYLEKNFADLAYVEPLYLKDFHSTSSTL